MTEHLDLDALADVLAEGTVGPDLRSDALPAAAEHLARCGDCQAALDALRAAVARVTGELATLAGQALPPMPSDLGERFDAAIGGLATDAAEVPQPAAPTPAPTGAAVAAAQTVLPPSEPVALHSRGGARRWMLPVGGGLAAAAALVFAVVLLVPGGGSDLSNNKVLQAPPQVAISSTGTDYLKDGKALKAALPTLLHANAATSPLGVAGVKPEVGGSVPKPSDPLTRLRSPAGLASCLASLNAPGDSTAPLALDYARYQGQPALVVVFASAKPSKLEVWVVGAGCTQADSGLLFYTRLDRPTG